MNYDKNLVSLSVAGTELGQYAFANFKIVNSFTELDDYPCGSVASTL